MQRRDLGSTGQSVSALGLGCMGMSEFYGAHDDAQSLETLAAALDRGIDFFDTADMYGAGHNERLLGSFLAGRPERPIVATKFGIVREPGEYARRIDNSPDYVRRACDASLARLGVERIDLYYCHRRNPEVPIEELIGAMAGLVRAGKVRWLGLSEVSVDTLRRAAAVHPIAAVQSEYSLWTRDPEAGMLDACRELGTSFVAYSPLGRAFLTGAVGSADDLAADDFRRINPRFQGEALAANRKLAAALTEFAAARGATAAQIALAWLLAKYPHVIPIPGTRRVRYLDENVAAADIALGTDELAALDSLFAPGAVQGERYPPEGMKGLEG
jgi:aryl-alcohol dehydrogenase-like predicted oxidoreductase